MSAAYKYIRIKRTYNLNSRIKTKREFMLLNLHCELSCENGSYRNRAEVKIGIPT